MRLFKAVILPFIFMLAGIIMPEALFSQITIRGVVRDAYNKQPIENVNVFASELHEGTSTDKRGQFIIQVNNRDTVHLKLTHVAYRSHVYTVIPGFDGSEKLIFLTPAAIEINPVTITATLNPRKISSLPGRVAVLNAAELENLAANNTDDLLQSVANVYINRPWGIFSKGASVSMRGLPGSSRTLILLNGVPMNKVSGGTINWNFIQSGDIEKIEVIKGPNSALYGNNAMGGVINLSTGQPERPLQGKIRSFGGSMNTYGGSLELGGTKKTNGKGFFWNGTAFYRTGEGYYIEPEETRDTTDAKVGLDEYNFGLEGGWNFDSTNTAGLQYRYYNGTFGAGTRIFEDDGAWDRYRSHLLTGIFKGRKGTFDLQARLYYQLENFDRQNESINRTGKYKLSDTESVKNDIGLWLNASRIFFSKHLFTAGFEFKAGNMDAREIYRTSTDRINYGGSLSFAGIFVQDEFNITRKLSAIAGLRFDIASFSGGFQDVTNPTSNTGFIRNTSVEFNNESWVQFSPKLALQYAIKNNLGAYVSVASGFMPPKIDDLTKSGKISKGFKLANPELKPESLINYEAGISWMPSKKLSIEPSVYYSRGYDFQYFVANGDSVETGGADLKPVLQRQNVSGVEIMGAEITARWELFTHFFITASYAMNDSEIVEFSNPYNEEKDITGNALTEVPETKAYASASWRNRIVNLLAYWTYTGKEWYDDENTQYLEPYHVFGVKLSKTLRQGLGFSLSADNIFDNVTIDRKGKLRPGRFVMAEIFYRL
ncbi:MAG: TonB-dependent receptor [Bacteroidales bacterium]|nr:TonB-dependent receptor [Bacteroidales bacterium]